MFHKNLKFYRLKKNMTKKELASLVGVSPMSITYYEEGERKPGMDVVKSLAKALDVRVSDFLVNRDENLVFTHGEFRKNSKLPEKQQEYIKASVEEYLNRFYQTVDILGGEVLPDAPDSHRVELHEDPEQDAVAMRRYLGIAEFGSVGNLVELLENKGILVYFCDIDNDAFSGMNGLVNDRPYMIINQNMTPERIRSTIAHEMAHFIFIWPVDMAEKDIEVMATATSGAFLFPAEDAKRELGIRRSAVTKDMTLICKEYGISMYLLVKRAALCGIINSSGEKDFYIKAGKCGWKKHEPVRIEREEPTLFLQLVLRAVSENEISVQKGAELLKQPYTFVADHTRRASLAECFAAEG
ncbi:MAG: XRE family transcriptional regulator [Lachnospiraceae bacterium]|nr:XRE family transcriptional regulator [Lachnospiraceae bacterium]